jgi:flagellar FliL protein
MALEKQDQFAWIKNRGNLVVVAGIAFGTALFVVILAFFLFQLFGKDHSSTTEQTRQSDAQIHYAAIDPPIVVNFGSGLRTRYLQIGIEVMSHDEKTVADFKQHMPVIRDRLILLLNGKHPEDLATPEGKEALRQEILQTIRAVLKERTGKEQIEAIYFTDFVMQ